MAKQKHRHEFALTTRSIEPQPWSVARFWQTEVIAVCLCGERLSEMFRAQGPWDSDAVYRAEILGVFQGMIQRAAFREQYREGAKKAAWRRYKSRRCGMAALS